VISSIINVDKKWMYISGNLTTSSVYMDYNKFQQSIAGQVRYNGSQFEVNDGNSWKTLYDNMVEVGLSPSAQEALAWAEKKMAVERQAEELARHNVTVKDALDLYQQQITDAEHQLKMVVALVQDYAQSV